jgi:hypothetical protein
VTVGPDQTTAVTPDSGVCPVCGYCKHCGHSPRPVPIVPWLQPCLPPYPVFPDVPYTPWYSAWGSFVNDDGYRMQNTAGGSVNDNAARLHTSGFAQVM